VSTFLLLSRVYFSVTNNNGFWIGWLDLLTTSCKSLVIKINYSAIANLPTSQSVWHAKSSQSSLVVSWQRIYKSHCNYSTYKVFTSCLSTDNWTTTELSITVVFSLHSLGSDHSTENTSVSQQRICANHTENTSCDTGSIVACVYRGRCVKMNLLYCWLSICCDLLYRRVP
jgi:hypothetical protein